MDRLVSCMLEDLGGCNAELCQIIDWSNSLSDGILLVSRLVVHCLASQPDATHHHSIS